MFLAGKSPNIRSYTVYIYDSGQPYLCVTTSYTGSNFICSPLPSTTVVSRYGSSVFHQRTYFRASSHIHRLSVIPAFPFCFRFFLPTTFSCPTTLAGPRSGKAAAAHLRSSDGCQRGRRCVCGGWSKGRASPARVEAAIPGPREHAAGIDHFVPLLCVCVYALCVVRVRLVHGRSFCVCFVCVCVCVLCMVSVRLVYVH